MLRACADKLYRSFEIAFVSRHHRQIGEGPYEWIECRDIRERYRFVSISLRVVHATETPRAAGRPGQQDSETSVFVSSSGLHHFFCPIGGFFAHSEARHVPDIRR